MLLEKSYDELPNHSDDNVHSAIKISLTSTYLTMTIQNSLYQNNFTNLTIIIHLNVSFSQTTCQCENRYSSYIWEKILRNFHEHFLDTMYSINHTKHTFYSRQENTMDCRKSRKIDIETYILRKAESERKVRIFMVSRFSMNMTLKL